MKAILAVVAVLLAVTHLGDTQRDHTLRPPFREPLVVVCVFVSSLFYLHNYTVLAEKPAFAVDGVSAKAL